MTTFLLQQVCNKFPNHHSSYTTTNRIMSKVTGEYPDGYSQIIKNDFYLDADQAMNPFTWEPPIHWNGIVGGGSK